MKKILSFILVICLTLSVLILATACSGESEGLEFELNEDGTSYIVVGQGTCNDTELVIPKKHGKLPVTAIADNALKSWSELTSVTIPGSVKTIGKKAFAFCSGLLEVKIENGVETIGEEAFRGCVKLVDIVLPESTVRIEKKAFAYCTDIENLTIKASSMTFGDLILENNKIIERISFGGTIEEWKTNVRYENESTESGDECDEDHDHGDHEKEDVDTVQWRYTTHIERVHCSDGAYFLD